MYSCPLGPATLILGAGSDIIKKKSAILAPMIIKLNLLVLFMLCVTLRTTQHLGLFSRVAAGYIEFGHRHQI